MPIARGGDILFGLSSRSKIHSKHRFVKLGFRILKVYLFMGDGKVDLDKLDLDSHLSEGDKSEGIPPPTPPTKMSANIFMYFYTIKHFRSRDHGGLTRIETK